MYSVSKSFVSLAVGLMIDEGKLSLDDHVARFFPDKAPSPVHPLIAEATVRDLLTMATPHSHTSYTVHDRDWAWTFFNREPSHPPGTVFSYDTAATVVLTSIVERLSGMPFLDYLRPRLLEPVGFSPDAWCVKTPEGTSWGGSGVLCTLRDMAKLAYVCMEKGRWGERQLISEGYISAATSKQIDNSAIPGENGYGYQIWRLDDNGFSFRGMGSQLALCFPDKDFLFACIGDTQGQGPTGVGILTAMREELYGSLSDTPLAENREALDALKRELSELAILPPPGELESPAAKRVSGVVFTMAANPMGITRMRLSFRGREGEWAYTNAQGENMLRFGLGTFVADRFPQKGYFGDQIGVPSGRRYECFSSAAWVEDDKLNLVVYITDDYLATLRVTMTFKDGRISVGMVKAAEWFLDEYEGFAWGEATTG